MVASVYNIEVVSRVFRQVHRQQKICLRVREEEDQLKRLKVKLKRMEPRFVVIFLVALSFPAFVESLARHYNFRVSTFLCSILQVYAK